LTTRCDKLQELKVYSLPELVVIDDDPAAIALVRCALKSRRVDVVGFTDPVLGLESIERDCPDIVLLGLNMPGLNGLEVLERIMQIAPSTDVILTTADYSTESAVRAIQMGASDYWTKPLDIDRLHVRLDTWLEERHRNAQRLKLDTELTRAYDFHGIVGRSPSLLDMFIKVRRIAPHFQTVLVRGETGTGKELVTKALHKLSQRSNQPLIVCNCAALVDSLVESELFGYIKGAFTGATQDRQGMIETADKGTLFLDEVGEIPLATQAKLLRVLQNREVRRVGSVGSRTVDMHIIAATNRDLRQMAAQGSFREDLYYRLAMVEIHVPSLSERREDLPLLFRHFLDKYANEYEKPGLALTPRAELLLNRYQWPGNIRELQHLIASCAMVADGALIDVRDLPQWIQHQGLNLHDPDDLISLAELYSRHAQRVLERVGGSQRKAAEILGIGRTTLYRLLRRESLSALAAEPDTAGKEMLLPTEDEATV
jgi:DNA-binding NtrC family response regulator